MLQTTIDKEIARHQSIIDDATIALRKARFALEALEELKDAWIHASRKEQQKVFDRQKLLEQFSAEEATNILADKYCPPEWNQQAVFVNGVACNEAARLEVAAKMRTALPADWSGGNSPAEKNSAYGFGCRRSDGALVQFSPEGATLSDVSEAKP